MPGSAEFPTLVITSTLKKYRNTFADNVFKETPLLSWLKRNDNVRLVDGGESIVEQLMYAANSTFASYSGYDTLSITAQEGFSAAVFPWKQIAVSVALNGLEVAQNAGQSKLFDITKAKIKQAEMSLADGWNTQLYGDGTGNAGKNFLGLQAIVGNHTTAPTLVGSIDCNVAGNEFWRSVVVDATADGNSVRDDDEWANAFYTASNGPGGSPDFIVTTQPLFEHYEASLVPQLRFTSNERADARFASLEFKNQRVYYDLACPTGLTYMLNSSAVALVGHRSVWMSPTDFKESPDKDAKWSQILCYGNLTTNNRRKNAKISGQTV